MKTIYLFFICWFLFLFASCDIFKFDLDYELKTDLDISVLAFPPKLSVTAILNSEKGHFSIFIAEGRAIADYVEPQPNRREIVRAGEIRLFEDDKLILSEPGPIDLSYIPPYGYMDEDGNWVNVTPYYWYSFEKYGLSTRPGAVYRLEVEVEGYQTATSTMTMPDTPVISASMDTTIQFIKRITPESRIHSGDLPFWLASSQYLAPDNSYETPCWTIAVSLTDPDPKRRNYFSLELLNYFLDDGDNYDDYEKTYKGIGVSDMSILQDNPLLDTYLIGRSIDTNLSDFFTFRSLEISDLTFSGKASSLTFYSAVIKFSDPFRNHPYYWDNPNFEKIVQNRKSRLQISHIPEVTFKHYRGQMLQNKGVGFFTEPVTIPGNIENGYGCFSVI